LEDFQLEQEFEKAKLNFLENMAIDHCVTVDQN
jgi:hypothetical protein